MKLYHSATSPYVRKVDLVLHLTGQGGAVERLPGGGTPMAPNAGTVSQNPLGKVPCLVTDEGLALYDSRVICRYLDHLAGGHLYPTGVTQWRVLTAEARADGVVDAALLVVYEARLRPEPIRLQTWVDGQLDKVRRGVAAMEADAAHLAGPLTIAHVATAAALGYLDFRHGYLAWRDGAPQLAAWYDEFARHPAMQTTMPKD